MAKKAGPEAAALPSGPPLGPSMDAMDGRGVPSQGDALGINESGSRGSDATKLIEYPFEVGEWMSRGMLLPDQVQRMVRILIEDEAVNNGYTDWFRMFWYQSALQLSTNGASRRDFLDALKARSKVYERNWLERGLGKSRGPQG